MSAAGGEEQRFFIKRQLQETGAALGAILLEPAGRNTAAAAALAAAWVRAAGRDELLLLMPSDHVIGNGKAFLAAIQTGAAHAEAGFVQSRQRPTQTAHPRQHALVGNSYVLQYELAGNRRAQ